MSHRGILARLVHSLVSVQAERIVQWNATTLYCRIKFRKKKIWTYLKLSEPGASGWSIVRIPVTVFLATSKHIFKEWCSCLLSEPCGKELVRRTVGELIMQSEGYVELEFVMSGIGRCTTGGWITIELGQANTLLVQPLDLPSQILSTEDDGNHGGQDPAGDKIWIKMALALSNRTRHYHWHQHRWDTDPRVHRISSRSPFKISI